MNITLEALEQALLQRANDLASEYQQRAQRSRDHLIEDENERLQLREEREIMAAKIAAERIYRAQVQSHQLQVQKKLDQLRWQLIKNVIEEVKNELNQLVEQEERYQRHVFDFIQYSLPFINDKGVIIEFNTHDYQRFAPQWPHWLQQFKTDKSLTLSEQCHPFSGGVLVYNLDRDMRIDQTFEGRLERLAETVYQWVAEQFFSELSHEGDKLHAR